MATTKPPKGILKKCPNCEKLAVPKFRPFCSSRCSQLDLSKWLNKNYRVPVVEIDDFDEEEFLDEEN